MQVILPDISTLEQYKCKQCEQSIDLRHYLMKNRTIS